MTTEPPASVVLTQIKKRNGEVQKFQEAKITNAIYKALEATGQKNAHTIAEQLKTDIVKRLQQYSYSDTSMPDVEVVQDMAESMLIEKGFAETAKAYILYRYEHKKVRAEKLKLLQKDELDEVDKALDINSLRVLEARYLLRDGSNKIVEGPKQLFERVAVTVALPDVLHDSRVFQRPLDSSSPSPLSLSAKTWIEEARSYFSKKEMFDSKLKIGDYYINKYHFDRLIDLYIRLAEEGKMTVGFRDLLAMIARGEFNSYAERITEYMNMMISRDFLPNTPTLMNAGAPLGQLSACFVLDMPDDLQAIMKTAMDAALIFKSGGGVGINYSDLRPKDDIVASTSGVASGPTSFMNIINTVTDVIKQGGKRRGANMGIMEVWHSDIAKFIEMKQTPGVMENFNVSVGIWDDFWQALIKNEKYGLHSPRSQAISKHINAQQLIDTIALSAYKSAEPGVIFFDNINKYNPAIPLKGPLRATNPCGEQSLYPYESCNLGSINLANFVKYNADGSNEFDWTRYEQAIRISTRFLDNVVDSNKYPIPEIDKESRATRRIGLGIMGLADALFLLHMPYNSQEGYEMMNKLAEALTYYSMDESIHIAKSRGAFPYFAQTDYVKGLLPVAGVYEVRKAMHNFDWDKLAEQVKEHGIRNSWNTTIAPTGTLSMLADCSNGVEPAFALAYEKRVTVGSFYYTNKVLEIALRQHGLYNDDVLTKIANNYGSVQGINEIPDSIKQVFRTAMDIHWVDHVMAQGVWQKWISNAIAKTINMPGDVTSDDIKCAYLLAHELGLKGITVFRDGSRQEQVLHITGENNGQKKFEVKPSEYAVDYINTTIKEPYVIEAIRSVIKEDDGIRKEQSSDTTESTLVLSLQLQQQSHEARKSPTAILVDKMNEKNLCPKCKEAGKNTELIKQAGCSTCIDCGFSGCSSG